MRYLICEPQFPVLFASMRRAYLAETQTREYPKAVFMVDIEPDYSMKVLEDFMHGVQFLEPLLLVNYLNGDIPIHALRSSLGDTLQLRAFQGIVEGLISDIRREASAVATYRLFPEGGSNAPV